MMIVLSIILLSVGLIIILAYIFSLIRCSIKTPAFISKIEEKDIPSRSHKLKEYYPVFTYTYNNKKYSEKANVSTNNKLKFKLNEKVFVYLNPKHPELIRYGKNTIYLLPGILFILSGVFFLVLSLI